MTAKNAPNLDRVEMEAILSEEEVGYLALASKGQPYCVPLSYAFLDGRIVIHCALQGRKIDLIRENPRCCFVVSRSPDPARPHRAEGSCSYRFESVVATGRARLVEDAEERLQLLKRFKGHFDTRLGLDPGENPVTADAAARCGCIVVEPDELSGRRKGFEPV
jgi:nitroimidazol reductase NimA-like FMN-containing flavoprotein (pyridoxamine 5'-phosphate oxidase superfamily)